MNDLHALMAPRWDRVSVADDDVHFNEDGSGMLGAQVARLIRERL